MLCAGPGPELKNLCCYPGRAKLGAEGKDQSRGLDKGDKIEKKVTRDSRVALSNSDESHPIFFPLGRSANLGCLVSSRSVADRVNARQISRSGRARDQL